MIDWAVCAFFVVHQLQREICRSFSSFSRVSGCLCLCVCAAFGGWMHALEYWAKFTAINLNWTNRIMHSIHFHMKFRPPNQWHMKNHSFSEPTTCTDREITASTIFDTNELFRFGASICIDHAQLSKRARNRIQCVYVFSVVHVPFFLSLQFGRRRCIVERILCRMCAAVTLNYLVSIWMW